MTTRAEVPIEPMTERPAADPRPVPAEAIVEEPAELWTIGRRSRFWTDRRAVRTRETLARAMSGKPALWVQRRRRPLLSPPASGLRFDALILTGDD
jgi:hypothetical protein